MPHPLEVQYQLSAYEILDGIASRFRLRVAVEGRVAELHLRKHIDALKSRDEYQEVQEYDLNGYADFSIWPQGFERPLLIECKTLRDQNYRKNGQIVAYKVEVQKTRAAKADPTSRFYDRDKFDILAVCLGRQTHRWNEFVFVKTSALQGHPMHAGKIAVHHRVPIGDQDDIEPWHRSLETVINSFKQ